MNPNNNEIVSTLPEDSLGKQPHPVNQITPVSKYLALALFIILPFLGAYIGYNLQKPHYQEVVIVEKSSEVNHATTKEISAVENATLSPLPLPKNNYLISARSEIFKGYYSKVIIPNEEVNGDTEVSSVITCDVFVITEGDTSIFDNVLVNYQEFTTQNVLPFSVVIQPELEWPAMWKEVLNNTSINNQVYAGITNYSMKAGKGYDTCEPTIEYFIPFMKEE
ncbi:MAG: hypothetical protein V4668_03690 [Patescibacteria group bacterium]